MFCLCKSSNIEVIEPIQETNCIESRTSLDINPESPHEFETFPSQILEKLGNVLADDISQKYQMCSVIFIDIAGFTNWCSENKAEKIIDSLGMIFQEWDMIAEKHKIFKIETVGDSWVGVAGVPLHDEHHAIHALHFGIDILDTQNLLQWAFGKTMSPERNLKLRVGIHSGPVVAGVLKGIRPRYQLFGDTMNTASRMESTCQDGRMQISESTFNLIKEYKYIFETPEPIYAKGIGLMQTYIYLGSSSEKRERRKSVGNAIMEQEMTLSGTSKKGKSVLLIDDYMSSLFRLAAFLCSENIQFTTANSGMQGLKHLKEKEYDAVFMDLWMDDKNGDIIVNEFRKWEHANLRRKKQIIYAFTASNMEELDTERLLNIGFDKIISKNVSREVFLKNI
tara:strand:- start:7542 stop:8723 length:1182 start_codon:yes stop_codon:yes gene_type:complete